ncbi:hypothetical protein AFLA70_2g008540 [Aspergillus flavus AF70]|nr:hypothetical protein AFLA70_2g008540 [Aspergillus flavus AF70]
MGHFCPPSRQVVSQQELRGRRSLIHRVVQKLTTLWRNSLGLRDPCHAFGDGNCLELW